MPLEPCAIKNLLFTVLSYDVTVDSKWAWSPGVGSVLPPGGGGWGLYGLTYSDNDNSKWLADLQCMN